MRYQEQETKNLQDSLSRLETHSGATSSLKEMVEKMSRLHGVMVRDVGLLEGHLRNYGYSLMHPDPAPENPFDDLLTKREALGDCVPMEGVTTAEPEVNEASITPRNDHQQRASPTPFSRSPLISPRIQKSARVEDTRKSLLSDTSSDNFLAKCSPVSLALRNKYGGITTDTAPSLKPPSETPSGNGSRTPRDSTQASLHGTPAALRQNSSKRDTDRGNALGSSSGRKSLRRVSLSHGSDFRGAGNLLQISEEENRQANTPRNKSPYRRVSFFDDQVEAAEASRKDLEMGGLGVARSVQLGVDEYNSLPGYMKSLSYEDMNEGLSKIKRVFENGEASITPEEIEGMGIGYSASFVHCLISLEYLARGFKHGKMVYEKGSRLNG
ncbi:hypothetical protein BSKO_08575 [Bryopsis sp. KO-2023]|nr:hypothetical protein BSKO_08575 [Bryopsis sp. KO-2023]